MIDMSREFNLQQLEELKKQSDALATRIWVSQPCTASRTRKWKSIKRATDRVSKLMAELMEM